VGKLAGAPPPSDPVLCGAHGPLDVSSGAVFGSFVSLSSGLDWNIAEVRSPTVSRRHRETFGTGTPHRSEISFNCEL
jgi:hypothetical protein